jgi:sulfur carrier protein ThiS
MMIDSDAGPPTERKNTAVIRVRLPQKNVELVVPGPKRVMDIVAAAGVRPATVLVTQGKTLLTKDMRVEDGQTVEIISVVSGG